MSTTHDWTLLRAGAFRLDGGGMFGLVPRTIWCTLTSPDPENRIPLQTNCVLLRGASGTVLIETGFGAKWSPKERSIYQLESRTIEDALADEGVDPASIDHVVVTHLHFDHAGGLTRPPRRGETDEPQPTFPNATVHVQRREWEDALANRSTMTRTYLRSHLDPVADRVRLADGAAEILPGVHVEPMVGHTWGQQAVRFRDEAGWLCFPGDVMPTVHHVGPSFNMAYDMLPYDNMHSKTRLLDVAAEECWRLILDHEPGEPVQTVHRDADRPGRHGLRPASATTP